LGKNKKKKCKICGSAIVLLSGKGTGYYGCYNAKRKTCSNTLLVPRKRIEETIVNDLRNKILTTKNLEYIFKNVEKLAMEGLNTIPDEIRKKKAALEKLKHDLQNYLNFVRIGNFSRAVSEAIKETEQKTDELQTEVSSLTYQKENSFKAPPKEWINYRLEKLTETLNKNTVFSSLALKELLGPIELEPIFYKKTDFYNLFEGKERNFKPYYIAHTKIQTLALLDDKHKGSNWLQWRRKKDSIGLFSLTPLSPMILLKCRRETILKIVRGATFRYAEMRAV